MILDFQNLKNSSRKRLHLQSCFCIVFRMLVLSIFAVLRLCCFYASTLGHCILRDNMHVGTFIQTKAFSLLTLFFLLFSLVFFCSFGMQKLGKFV